MFLSAHKKLHIFRHLQVSVFVSTETAVDPYLMDEDDPAQCGALESSLWEIKVCLWSHNPGQMFVELQLRSDVHRAATPVICS